MDISPYDLGHTKQQSITPIVNYNVKEKLSRQKEKSEPDKYNTITNPMPWH